MIHELLRNVAETKGAVCSVEKLGEGLIVLAYFFKSLIDWKWPQSPRAMPEGVQRLIEDRRCPDGKRNFLNELGGKAIDLVENVSDFLIGNGMIKSHVRAGDLDELIESLNSISSIAREEYDIPLTPDQRKAVKSFYLVLRRSALDFFQFAIFLVGSISKTSIYNLNALFSSKEISNQLLELLSKRETPFLYFESVVVSSVKG